MAIPPAIYGVLMFFTAAAFGLVGQPWPPGRAGP